MAEPDWGPVQRVSTYELVLERIQEQLIAGTLRAGDRLPPERELAARLGASRQAVREALRVLQAQGVVRSQVGTGADSGTVIVPAPASALTRLLKVHLAVTSFPVEDLTGTRVMLERTSAAAAAQRQDVLGLARMAAALEAMDAPDIEQEPFNELDTEFHVAIAESGGNRLVSELTVAVRESIKPALLAGIRADPDWAALRALLRAEHRGIHEAIADGDAASAAERVEAHVRSFHRRIGPSRSSAVTR